MALPVVKQFQEDLGDVIKVVRTETVYISKETGAVVTPPDAEVAEPPVQNGETHAVKGVHHSNSGKK